MIRNLQASKSLVCKSKFAVGLGFVGAVSRFTAEQSWRLAAGGPALPMRFRGPWVPPPLRGTGDIMSSIIQSNRFAATVIIPAPKRTLHFNAYLFLARPRAHLLHHSRKFGAKNNESFCIRFISQSFHYFQVRCLCFSVGMPFFYEAPA